MRARALNAIEERFVRIDARCWADFNTLQPSSCHRPKLLRRLAGSCAVAAAVWDSTECPSHVFCVKAQAIDASIEDFSSGSINYRITKCGSCEHFITQRVRYPLICMTLYANNCVIVWAGGPGK